MIILDRQANSWNGVNVQTRLIGQTPRPQRVQETPNWNGVTRVSQLAVCQRTSLTVKIVYVLFGQKLSLTMQTEHKHVNIVKYDTLQRACPSHRFSR